MRLGPVLAGPVHYWPAQYTRVSALLGVLLLYGVLGGGGPSDKLINYNHIKSIISWVQP